MEERRGWPPKSLAARYMGEYDVLCGLLSLFRLMWQTPRRGRACSFHIFVVPSPRIYDTKDKSKTETRKGREEESKGQSTGGARDGRKGGTQRERGGEIPREGAEGRWRTKEIFCVCRPPPPLSPATAPSTYIVGVFWIRVGSPALVNCSYARFHLKHHGSML